ncbi:MAG: site-2 protease family protein [Oscillospiraceae bacterium]|nr:site-2 protease family protein [Oscillospiraceae bacterium]
MTFFYVIIAILIFGLLIVIHELGHFSAAKLFGVRVEEFAVGMGPALLKKQKGETLYSLRAIPLGGYCAMTGEDGESEDPRAFINQKAWKRLIILAAGSFNNFLLGVVIVLCLFAGTKQILSPVIVEFMEGCPYESAEGLQVGDRITAIDGHSVLIHGDIDRLLHGDGVYDIEVERAGQKLLLKSFELRRVEYPEGLFFGLRFGQYDEATPRQIWRHSWNTVRDYVGLVWQSLGMLLHGEASVNDLAGPVYIVDMMAESGAQEETVSGGLWTVFNFGAFIALNLAVMNMLPIPALDGGRIFLLLVTALIEALTRKKLNPKYEAYIHAAGMVLLLALMAYVMLHDIVRLVTG